MRRRTERWLDIAIRATAVIALALAAYLAYSYWAGTRQQEQATPAGRAIENLATIVRANPGNAGARVRLAEALGAAGRLKEAVEQYEAALEIQPDLVVAMNGLATVAMKQKDFETAEATWKKIIAQLDTSTSAAKSADLDAAYYGLGVTYIEMERYEDAIIALKESVRIKMDASDTHYFLSVAYARLGYPEQQKEELAITLAFDPGNAQANYDMGLLSVKASEVATAAELFRISVNAAPDDKKSLPQAELDKIAAQGSASERLERAQLSRTSDPAKALSEARIAAALDPKSVEAIRLVAQLWDAAGNKERALNAYQRLQELAPGDAGAAEAIKRLSALVQ